MSLIGDVKIQNTYSAEALSGTAKTATNSSIYTDSRLGQVVEEEVKTQNTTKIDELLGKLATELQKENINIDVNEIKNSGVLFRITGLNQQQIENSNQKELDTIKKSIVAAMEDLSSNGNIELEDLGISANNYYLAQKTEWSIDGFRKWNAGKKQEQNLFTRLKELTNGCPKIKELIGKYDRVEDVPEENLKKAVDIFFNEVIIGENKSPENVKKQIQTFGRLLINTPDNEKKYFKNILSSLVAENRAPGLEAVLASFDTPESRSEWASSWTVEEMKAFNEGVSVETATKNIAKIIQYQKEEAIKRNQGELQEEAKVFFEKNQEILETIAKKEANNEELTDKEKAIKAERDNYLSIKAGEIVGTATNEIISTDAKAEILDKMNRDAYELPIYKEVMEGVKNIVEKNPELVTISKEEFAKILDEATNGNYTKVVNGNTETLNAPYVEKTETANNTDNVGYKNAKTIDTTIVEAKKQEIINTTEPIEKIEIVKLNSKASEQATNNNFIGTELKYNALRSAGNITQYLNVTGETKFDFAAEVFQKFSDASSTTKKWAMDYLTNASFAVQNLFLNKVSHSMSAMVAAAKEIDLTKFNLIGMTTTTEKQVEKIQEEKI